MTESTEGKHFKILTAVISELWDIISDTFFIFYFLGVIKEQMLVFNSVSPKK